VRHALRFVVFLAVVGAIVGGFVLAWGWSRFLADFWPPDSSRIAPNIVAALVGGVVSVTFMLIFYKPFRDAVSRLIHRHTDSLHAKLDHIIEHHPDIPPMPKEK
jgi:hypothetical protein